MLTAIQNGDRARVAALIADGADVNTSEGPRPPLLLALRKATSMYPGNPAVYDPIALELIRAGANVHISDPLESFWTPMTLALQRRTDLGLQTDLVAALLAAGSDPRWTHPDHGGLLNQAVQSGNHAVLRMLIRAGAPLDIEDQDATPLGWAADEGNLEAMRILLDAGADPDRVTDPEAKERLVLPLARLRTMKEITMLPGIGSEYLRAKESFESPPT